MRRGLLSRFRFGQDEAALLGYSGGNRDASVIVATLILTLPRAISLQNWAVRWAGLWSWDVRRPQILLSGSAVAHRRHLYVM